MSVPLRVPIEDSVPFASRAAHTPRTTVRQADPRRTRAAAAFVALTLICLGVALAARYAGAADAGLRFVPDSITGALLRLNGAAIDRRLGFLTVTGSVTNHSGAPQENVEAVVELLDANGQPIGYESALIAFSRLDRSETSPFSVTMQDDSRARAYRIYFRTLLGIRLG